MNDFKLLLVEDNDAEKETYKNVIELFKETNNVKIYYQIASSLEDAKIILNSSYDGAIIDIRLKNSALYEGIEIINEIQNDYRIPIAIYTGVPSSIENINENIFLRKYIKGEKNLNEILSDLFKIYRTGITQVLGGRGKIETALNSLFWKNILPGFEDWIRDKEDGLETEPALLRWIINHIQELICVEDESHFFPSETYIIPKINPDLQTGDLVENSDKKCFIIMTPACDLEKRKNGKFKTNRILICEIESYQEILNTWENSEKKKNFKKVTKNTYSLYYHFLPGTLKFGGGIINFRKIKAETTEAYEKNFKTIGKITDYFLKDIISRFSIFYARQGQPDFNFDTDKFIDKLIH